MHNITKIKIFRILLRITWFPSLLFLYPLALLRKKQSSGLFFFFDRYVMGGAQRIHLDILEALSDTPKKIFFTRHSANDVFKTQFYRQPNTECKDVHLFCDYLLLRLFSVHYFAFYLNRHLHCRVLGANSTFFYDMLPFLKKDVKKVELLHNFSFGKNGMEFFGLLNCRFLDLRIIYDPFTRSNILSQYSEYRIDPVFSDRLAFIEPGVTIPQSAEKEFGLPLKVLCAGRGGPQKRIWLINRIALHFIHRNAEIQFHFAGTLIAELEDAVAEAAVIHGEISDPAQMQRLYQQCHVALLTSGFEGFPMFIKEAMANGTIPVVTALPGNLLHLKDNDNALLLTHPAEEEKVILEAIAILEKLIVDQQQLRRLSLTDRQYAKDRFSKAVFAQQYREILLGLN